MLMPQWQTNTPMRGSWPQMSRSSGYSLVRVRLPRAGARISPAWAEAPKACMTVSGMSRGAWNTPQV
jgi:hypothetical protein